MIEQFYKKIIKNLKSEKVFFKYNDKTKSFIDLKDFVQKFFSLSKYFPKKKNKIFLISNKSFESYATMASIILSGNTWVQISTNIPKKRLVEIYNIARPDVVFFDEISNYKLSSIKNFLAKKKVKIFKIKDIYSEINKEINLNVRHLDNDPAMIFFTSGSTGIPKGVSISKKNFISSFLKQYDKLYRKDTNLIFGDYHDNSFVIILNILLPCLYGGYAISPSVTTRESLLIFDHAINNKVNTIITVPSNINNQSKYYSKKKN